MKIILDTLDIHEALRYTGYSGQALDGDMSKRLESAKRRVLESADACYTFMLTPISENENGVTLDRPEIFLPGAALRRHLRGCAQAVLFCVTLGGSVEMLLRREQLIDRANALLLDACASAAVERCCELACAAIERELCPTGFELTSRFSPGYADLPLSIQRELCAALDTQKKLGVCVHRGAGLTPRKSVTAIAGITSSPERCEPTGCGDCEGCPRRESCQLKRASAYRYNNIEGAATHEKA